MSMEDNNSLSSMLDRKDSAISLIESARSELEGALERLKELPTLDPNIIRYAAHAMKNYLSVASGGVDLLSHALAHYQDRDVSVWLEGLKHCTRLMTQTVRLLSNASVAMKLDLKWEKVDMLTLVQRGCSHYNAHAREKRIKIIFRSFVKSPYAWTDRVAIAVVLDNLLSNAIKFSDPGKLVRVVLKEEPDHLVCSVQDEGPGLTEDEQAKLFEKGARLGPAPTGGELSIGYGLAICKDIIRDLRGDIWYERQSPRGSCFSFRLPMSVEGKSEHHG